MDHDALAARYLAALNDLDPAYLDRQHPAAKSRPVASHLKPGLSGLFLPSVPANLARAKNRIMVVGSETAGWNVLRPEQPFPGLPAYIEQAMRKHRAFFERRLAARNDGGATFHNFMRAVAERSGADGLMYANLFCFDWNAGNPMQPADCFATIKKYSERLLKAQIETLRPELIIFANGISSVATRREFFPIDGERPACTNGRNYVAAGIRSHHLWEFDLYGTIRCVRIHHPAARSQEAARARAFLLGLLPQI